MKYQTIFEMGLRAFPWGVLFHPLILVVVGLVLFVFSGARQLPRILGAVGAAFGAMLFLILAIRLIPDYFGSRQTYLNGNSSIVEGQVKNFRPTPSLGAARESFSVGGRPFSFNVLDTTPCFHDAPLHKGPIHEGLYVRIYFKGDCIQRLDVRY
jgi:hypothetical protein